MIPLGVKGRIALGSVGPVVGPGVGIVGEDPIDAMDSVEPGPVPRGEPPEAADQRLGEVVATIATRLATDINTCFRAFRFDLSP